MVIGNCTHSIWLTRYVHGSDEHAFKQGSPIHVLLTLPIFTSGTTVTSASMRTVFFIFLEQSIFVHPSFVGMMVHHMPADTVCSIQNEKIRMEGTRIFCIRFVVVYNNRRHFLQMVVSIYHPGSERGNRVPCLGYTAPVVPDKTERRSYRPAANWPETYSPVLWRPWRRCRLPRLKHSDWRQGAVHKGFGID